MWLVRVQTWAGATRHRHTPRQVPQRTASVLCAHMCPPGSSLVVVTRVAMMWCVRGTMLVRGRAAFDRAGSGDAVASAALGMGWRRPLRALHT